MRAFSLFVLALLIFTALTPAEAAMRRPDVVVTSIALNPTSPKANNTFSAKVTVKNQGKAAADGGGSDLMD